MLNSNWYLIFLTAAIPVIIGYIYYHPTVMGNRLSKISGIDINDIGSTKNIKRIFSIYGLGLLISYLLLVLCVHQVPAHLLFLAEPQMADPNFEGHAFLQSFMEQVGDRHRSITHGMIHGLETGLFMGVAVLGATALIEGKSFKKIWIHVGYWMLNCVIIGAIWGGYFNFN